MICVDFRTARGKTKSQERFMKTKVDVIGHIVRFNDPNSVIHIFANDVLGPDEIFTDETIGAAISHLAHRIRRDTGFSVATNLEDGIWMIRIKPGEMTPGILQNPGTKTAALHAEPEGKSYFGSKYLFFESESGKGVLQELAKMEQELGAGENQHKISPAEMESTHVKLIINEAAFKQLLPDLLGKIPGPFVAMSDGKMVDSDPNERELVIRASQNRAGSLS
jgi:hypothetical protein